MFARRKWMKSVLLILLCWIMLCLSGCSPARMPINFTRITVSPDPAVGQIVNLQIEVTSKYDEPEVTYTVDLDFLEEFNIPIHYISGITQWVGPMAANETKTFDLTICVWEEGNWPIEMYAKRTAPGNSYEAFEKLFIESRIDGGKIIRGVDYEPRANQITPTPRPFLVSPECSGNPTE